MQSAKPGSIPAPDFSSALRSSLAVSPSFSLYLYLSISYSPPLALLSEGTSFSLSLSFSLLSISFSARAPSLATFSIPPAREPRPAPRVQHRFSHKNSLRSTLSLGYYFLPGLPTWSGAFRSRNSPLCKCATKEDLLSGIGVWYRRARNEEVYSRERRTL